MAWCSALFAEFMTRIADQTERARAAGTLDLGVETLRGEGIEQVSAEDLWTCPRSGASSPWTPRPAWRGWGA